MYGPTRPPAWHRDLLWVAGVILLVATVLGTGALLWWRLADADTGPRLVERGLRLTLLPGPTVGDEGAALQVRSASGIEANEPFEVLPGSGVQVDPTELQAFDGAAAIQRVAGVWSERIVSDGSEALLSGLGDPELRAQLDRVLDGPGVRVVDAELARTLMPAGLETGSRLANWPLQAQQNPGEPVQPVVGLFQFFDADQLQGSTNRQVGEAAVMRLAEVTIREGAEEARASIANATLLAAYDAGLGAAREALHDLVVATLTGREAQADDRLAEAREIQAVAAEEASERPGLAGLLPEAELAGLTPEQANERVVQALAERLWTEGPEPLASLLENDPRAQRAVAAGPVLAPFTRHGAARARGVVWASAVIAVVAWVAMAAFARGAGRWTRPGAAIVLGVAPFAVVAWWASARLEAWAAAGWPAGVAAEGTFAQWAGLTRVVAASLPADAVEAAVRTTVIVGGIGVAAFAIGLLILAASAFRPRRRGPF
ncbi:MAG: hypothetical protein WD336_09755 [Trueperaceae bacterium]